MRRGVRIGAGQQDAPVAAVGPGAPDLLAVHDVAVAVALGPGAQRGQVRPGVGLAEQLAPLLRAVEDAGQPPLLLLGRAAGDDGRPGPAQRDGVRRDESTPARPAPRR